MKTLLGQYSLNEGTNPAGIYLLKVNKTNTRILSGKVNNKDTRMTPLASNSEHRTSKQW